MFSQNSYYFRNALVRANYENLTIGVTSTNIYLIKFLENLLFEGKNILKSRELQIKQKSGNDTVISRDKTVSITATETVFSIIKGNITITAIEIAQILGIRLATVKRRIKVLKDKKIIERIGSDKTGHWSVLAGESNK